MYTCSSLYMWLTMHRCHLKTVGVFVCGALIHCWTFNFSSAPLCWFVAFLLLFYFVTCKCFHFSRICNFPWEKERFWCIIFHFITEAILSFDKQQNKVLLRNENTSTEDKAVQQEDEQPKDKKLKLKITKQIACVTFCSPRM